MARVILDNGSPESQERKQQQEVRMAYSVQKFVAAVLSIAAKQPTYRTGGTGRDGTCDCVGLIMGALYALGRRKYELHSSNYFARKQMQSIRPVASELDCRYGMVLYKAREDQGGLNARYKPGGRCYTGDLLDYYHVGVVTSVMPLHITHCTSGGGVDGIKTDYAMGSWRCGGELADVDYDAQAGEGDTMEVMYRAVVTASKGATVNLRASPKDGTKLIERVPLGTAVDVWEDAQGWAHIQTDAGRVGYMQSKYLERQEDGGEAGERLPSSETALDMESVAVFLPKYVVTALLEAVTKGLGSG